MMRRLWGGAATGPPRIDDVQEWTATAVGDGASREKVYGYSVAGRLVAVRDATTGVDPATGEPVSTCGKWTYAFDSDGNRTGLARTPYPTSDCTGTPGTPTATSYAYDDADRATTQGQFKVDVVVTGVM